MVKIPNDEVVIDEVSMYKTFYVFFPGVEGHKIDDLEFQSDPVFRVAEFEAPSIPDAFEEFEQEFTQRTGKLPEDIRMAYGGVCVKQNRIQILYVILRGQEEMLSRRIDTIGIDLWDPKSRVVS